MKPPLRASAFDRGAVKFVLLPLAGLFLLWALFLGGGDVIAACRALSADEVRKLGCVIEHFVPRP